MDEISLYFHIPFCRNKCLYCDFYSGGSRIADWEALTRAFLNEIQFRKSEWSGKKIVSIYFGGGTPSLIPVEILRDLILEIRDEISEGAVIAEDCEMTIEVNPEDVSDEKVLIWKELGFNRVSLGIQSFNEELLKRIGRRHSGQEAAESLKILVGKISNVSADLIFGLPGQSINDVENDLKNLIEFHPQHISIYSLMYEPGTALNLLKEQGSISPVDEEVAEEMFQIITTRLRDAGYEQYETSNYSLPGYRSRHNSGYWIGRPYIGIGPSAHSFDGKVTRRANPADIKGYLNSFYDFHADRGSGDYQIIEEKLSLRERIEECIMLGLRLRDGISLMSFEEKFGEQEKDSLLKRAEEGLRTGNLELTPPDKLRISDKGIMITDSIIIDLI